jgi:polyferredoxin
MPRSQNRSKKESGKKQVAETTKWKLVMLISFLLAIVLFLGFRVGESLWPTWMIEYRRPIIGLVLFATFILIAASPLVIEANSHPRPLSGPGHNPELPPSSWNQ